MSLRNDRFLCASGRLHAAAEALTDAAELLSMVDRRLEAGANTLALAADNLMGNVLSEVVLAPMEFDNGNGTS